MIFALCHGFKKSTGSSLVGVGKFSSLFSLKLYLDLTVSTGRACLSVSLFSAEG